MLQQQQMKMLQQQQKWMLRGRAAQEPVRAAHSQPPPLCSSPLRPHPDSRAKESMPTIQGG